MCMRPETSFDTQGLLIRSIISLLSVCRAKRNVKYVPRDSRRTMDLEPASQLLYWNVWFVTALQTSLAMDLWAPTTSSACSPCSEGLIAHMKL